MVYPPVQVRLYVGIDPCLGIVRPAVFDDFRFGYLQLSVMKRCLENCWMSRYHHSKNLCNFLNGCLLMMSHFSGQLPQGMQLVRWRDLLEFRMNPRISRSCIGEGMLFFRLITNPRDNRSCMMVAKCLLASSLNFAITSMLSRYRTKQIPRFLNAAIMDL